jgi:heme-degrading monooxygenase HmoA
VKRFGAPAHYLGVVTDASGAESGFPKSGRGEKWISPTPEAHPGPPEGFMNRDALSPAVVQVERESSTMSQIMEMGIEVSEELDSQSDSWKAKPPLETFTRAGVSTSNARAVEFIAKPGKAAELEECIRGKVLEFLKKRAGFLGAVVLTSHKESRLILVISFWSTERAAVENRWEDSRVVRQIAYPLIDVRAKVQTYTAAIPSASRVSAQMADLQVC